MRILWACQGDDVAADCAQRLLEQGEALTLLASPYKQNGGRP